MAFIMLIKMIALCLCLNVIDSTPISQGTRRQEKEGYGLQQPLKIPSRIYNNQPFTTTTRPFNQNSLGQTELNRQYISPQNIGQGSLKKPSFNNKKRPVAQFQVQKLQGNLYPEVSGTRHPQKFTTPSSKPMKGMPYDIEWAVNDVETDNFYSHAESSDGAITKGEYKVLLPDGRLQIVTFIDRGNGYEATVTYE